MTFLALGIEKSCLQQQKDMLEFEEMVYANNYNNITEQLSSYLSEGGSTTDSTACALEATQELYDSKKSAIESQLETINAELDSYDKAVQTNIKSECKLSISV